MAFEDTATITRDTGTLISDPASAISGRFRVQNLSANPVLIKAAATTTPPTDWSGAIQLMHNDPITGSMAELFPSQPLSGYLHAMSYSLPGMVSVDHG